MPSELALQKKTLPGLLPDKDAADLCASFPLLEENGAVLLRVLPDANERRYLTIRQGELDRVLRPVSYAMADKDAAVRALAGLFAGYPSLRKANVEEMLVAYMAHLQELPLFAVERACEDICRGRVKDLDSDWPPSSPRIYEIADAHARKIVAEKIRFDKVLSAKVLPVVTEKQARVAGGKLEKLAALLRMNTEKETSERVAEFAEKKIEATRRLILEAYEARGIDPVITEDGTLLSPFLLDLLKVQRA